MKAKAAARFNGRQGGRFAEEGAGALAFELHAARLRELAKGPAAGTWPASSLDEWKAIADRARDRDEGVSLSPREAMALDVVDAATEHGWIER